MARTAGWDGRRTPLNRLNTFRHSQDLPLPDPKKALLPAWKSMQSRYRGWEASLLLTLLWSTPPRFTKPRSSDWKRRKYNMLFHPADSPDLNPNEYVWVGSKRSVDTFPIRLRDIEEFCEVAQRVWDEIPQPFSTSWSTVCGPEGGLATGALGGRARWSRKSLLSRIHP